MGRRLERVQTEQEQVVGFVSIGDLVRATVTEQAHMIEHLQRYLAG